MDCKKADQLMMKYMDMLITEEEAKSLKEHISECTQCKESFLIYDMMMDEFSEFELIEAPEGFEEAVMSKIYELEPVSVKAATHFENVIYFAWSIVSITIGVALLLAFNRDAILDYVINTGSLAAYQDIIILAYNQVEAFLTAASERILSGVEMFNGLLSSAKYYLIAAFGVLVSIQFFIYRKDKVEA